MNIFGYEEIGKLVSGEKPNILSLLIPGSLGQISTIYGPAILLLFFYDIKKSRKDFMFLMAISIFFFSHYFFGSNLNRFFYEGFLWSIYLLKNNSSHLFEKFKIKIKFYF